jgi:predicted transposase YbfD/YdcC
LDGLTVSFDGKTVRSTGKMKKYTSPMHIISAYIAELGVTFGQQAVHDKSNEIPAVRELIGMLKLDVVAGADYLLSVKDNQETLKKDIEDYVQDDDLRKTMDTAETSEKSRGRIERRTAFTTSDIDWLYNKDAWKNLICIGAINTQFTSATGTTNEWHYYISSRGLSAEELLKHARSEWSVETMHWLLDVHFSEDFCRVEDEFVQQNLNMFRKIVLNHVKRYKEKTGDKRPVSKILFGCLLDPEKLLPVLDAFEN